MEAEFWIKAWEEGRTGFHQADYHLKLVEYFPRLDPKEGQTVLVPLCGKTKDLIWLADLGLKVHGIELYEEAVKAFFSENNILEVNKTTDPKCTNYTYNNIVVSCGDFFKFDEKSNYDFVYDRASLVALPPEMRSDYAQIIKDSMRSGGKYLLIVYEYDPAELQGPPFSIEDKEIHELYGDQFSIKLMEVNRPMMDGPRLMSLESLRQKVYILEKFI